MARERDAPGNLDSELGVHLRKHGCSAKQFAIDKYFRRSSNDEKCRKNRLLVI